jgi:GntR family transcriptional regulator
MPSESQMIEMFGVSRITIRRALHELENEGLIFGVHGKGTFVSKPKAFQDLTHLQSFGEAMQPHGYETFSKVVSLKELRPSDHVAEKLMVAKSEKVTEIKRVRYLNRDPMSVETSYFPEVIGRRLVKEDLSSKDIFLILENDFGIVLGAAELVVGAHLADDLQARLLGVESGSPMLHIERLTSAANGQPVNYEHLYHRGDSFRYKVRVERSASKVKK